jgi:tRNA dimethylallyltransferase
VCKVVVIGGVTASGKSNMAVELAQKNNGIIINADSLQLYSGLPILSAQPSRHHRELVEHKLYAIYSPYQRSSVFDWLQIALEEINGAIAEKKLPIVVGGTGMYISRLIDGIREIPSTDQNLRKYSNTMYDDLGWNEFHRVVREMDPEGVSRIEQHNRQRLIRLYEINMLSGKKLSELDNTPNNLLFNPRDIFLINILPARDIIYGRCESRFRMFLDDAVREVQGFMEKYSDISEGNYPVSHTLGFSEIRQYISGELSRDDMISLSIKKIRHYAKRQYTWFRNQFKQIDFLLEHIPNKEDLNKLSEEINVRILKDKL